MVTFKQKIRGENGENIYSLQELKEKVDKEQPKNNNKEIWRFAQKARGNNYYIASNLGNIRLYTNIKWEQTNKDIIEIHDDNIEQIKEITCFKDEKNIRRLDKEKFIDQNPDCVYIGELPVYKLVADAWLEYEYKTNHLIHHIYNNGDDSIYNLIYIPNNVHGKIHKPTK